MKSKTRKIIYWILGAIVVFFIGKIAFQIFKALNQDAPFSKTTLTEYKNLFPPKAIPDLANTWNYNSKVRNQFSLFDYGRKKKYCILVYNIPVVDGFSFNRIITEKRDHPITGTGGYIVINENYTEFNYKIGRPKKAKEIVLSYVNDNFKLVRSNDGIHLYYYFGSQFSFRLNQEKKPDIYGGVKNNQIKLPYNIAFIKKRKKVYLVILTVNNLSDSFGPNKLNKILNSEKNIGRISDIFFKEKAIAKGLDD